MDYRLIYTKSAERDLEEIVRYIARESPQAAEQVGLSLLGLAESLIKLPYRGAALRSRPGVRKVLCMPYLVLYRVDESQQLVRILRFWHAKRDQLGMRLE